MGKGRDKRKRAARRNESSKPPVVVRPQDSSSDDPAALAPLEPKPKPRSGAIAVLQPEQPEVADVFSQATVKMGEIEGNRLVERIKAAFANTEYPGFAALSDSVHEEPEKFGYLKDRSWRELHLDKMPGLSDVLMWLSPDGLRYYLPAFLIAAITIPAVPGTRDVIGELAPPGPKNPHRNFFLQLVDGLTTAQKDAVRECLQHLRINRDGIYSWWS